MMEYVLNYSIIKTLPFITDSSILLYMNKSAQILNFTRPVVQNVVRYEELLQLLTECKSLIH